MITSPSTVERAPDADAPLAAGSPLAPGYEVIEHLRRGNDLDVYDVWSVERMARCVIKSLRPNRLDDRPARQRLIHEGRLLESISHPHIVRAYATDPAAGMIVLETLPGATLAALVEEDVAPAPAEVAHLGLQLGSALHSLHRHGVLHLDLKPSNIVAHAGIAKVLDLSLARPAGPAAAGIGTWEHMAPEQARGGNLTAATDIWGLGGVLFEVATGEGPFADLADEIWAEAPGPSTATESGEAPERYPQLERAARDPRLLADIGDRLASVTRACLAAEPAERPSLAALMAELEAVAGVSEDERRWRSHRAR